MSRAPAAPPEMTQSRALENIDPKNTGRVAQRKRCCRVFTQPYLDTSVSACERIIRLR